MSGLIQTTNKGRPKNFSAAVTMVAIDVVFRWVESFIHDVKAMKEFDVLYEDLLSYSCNEITDAASLEGLKQLLINLCVKNSYGAMN